MAQFVNKRKKIIIGIGLLVTFCLATLSGYEAGFRKGVQIESESNTRIQLKVQKQMKEMQVCKWVERTAEIHNCQ